MTETILKNKQMTTSKFIAYWSQRIASDQNSEVK